MTGSEEYKGNPDLFSTSDIAVEEYDGLLRFVLPEVELDVFTTPTVKEKVTESMERNDLRGVIINLDNVQFIDQAMLGVCIGFHKRLKARRVPFVLEMAEDSRIYSSFRLTGLTQVLRIMPERPGVEI